MAQGDAKLFNDFVKKVNDQQYADTDTYSIAFLSDTYASIDTDALNPQLSNFTVTSGGNIPASTNLVNFDVTRTTNVTKFDADDPSQFAKDAANPADVRCALIYNNTSTNDDAFQVYDLTTDGSTPLDLVNNDFTFSFGANGIATATNTSA